jgi:hypothetical protein
MGATIWGAYRGQGPNCPAASKVHRATASIQPPKTVYHFHGLWMNRRFMANCPTYFLGRASPAYSPDSIFGDGASLKAANGCLVATPCVFGPRERGWNHRALSLSHCGPPAGRKERARLTPRPCRMAAAPALGSLSSGALSSRRRQSGSGASATGPARRMISEKEPSAQPAGKAAARGVASLSP